jgi:MFS family permease
VSRVQHPARKKDSLIACRSERSLANDGEGRLVRFYYGWVIVAVALITLALTWGIGLFSFTLWAEPLAKTFGASRGEVMGANLLVNFGAGLMSPLAGFAMDKRSIRLLMVAGVALIALGLVLVSVAGAMWQISVLYGLVIAAGLVLTGPIAAQTLAVKWFRRRRGLAIGLVAVGAPLGGFAVPPLAGLLLDLYGWRAAYLLLTALMVVIVAPLVWFLVRNTPEDKGVEPEAASPGAENAVAAEEKVWSTAEILRDRTFWGAVIIFVATLLAFNGYFFNLGPIVADLGGTTTKAALVVSLGSLMAVIGTIAAGAFADRIDHRLILTLIVVSMVAGLGVLSTGASYALLLATNMVMGITVAGVLPLVGAVMAARFGAASFSRAFGLVSPSITIAGAGAFIAGSARDMLGSYDGAFLVLMVALLPAFIGLALIKPKPGPVMQVAPS